MSAVRKLPGLTTPATKTLEDFVVIPGETLEESIGRAVSWHIHNNPFSEIIRVISKKRLEMAIAEMPLTDEQQTLMYEMLGQAAFPAQGIAAKLMNSVTRTSLRNKLAKQLPRTFMLILRAYEHHLEHRKLPPAPAEAPRSIFGMVH